MDRTSFVVMTLSQLAVSAMLLGFLLVVGASESVQTFVLGAITAHWLQQTVRMGQQAATVARANGNGHGAVL
jgi:hypothetical protein